MEDIPPSYIQSTNTSVLDLVAPYLDTLSLHALTLVSRSYHETFMPYLWGSPASHFVPMAGPTLPGDPDNPQAHGSLDDMVYVALTRFKRTLKKARLSTRLLVHTLFLPPALSEIYGGPHATWLKEILDGLPNLQSLCVGGLPFFDHHSLVAVDRQKGPQTKDEFHIYPLKLLLAAKEPNMTSHGLSMFLPHVPNLVYLDLSYTTPARDVNVLSSLSLQSDLQVLKLRGIGLRDIEAEALANAIGRKVRLLDLAENLLSDMAIRSLLQACFQISAANIGTVEQPRRTSPSRQRPLHRQGFETWPVGLPPAPDFLSLDTLRSSDFDKNLRVQLTNPLTGRLAFEDIPHAGLTHLYITGNPNVTIEGVKSLLATGKLHVLDAGELANETMVDKYVRNVVDTGRMQDPPPSYHSRSGSTESGRTLARRHESRDADILFPGAEKLIPVLRERASQNLTYFRIDHAVITKQMDPVREKSTRSSIDNGRVSPVELSGQIGVTQLVEIPGTNRQPVEMPANQVFEMDATPVVRAELPGDMIHFSVTPAIGQKPGLQQEEPKVLQPVRGEGAYAPEAVSVGNESENPKQDVSEPGKSRPLSAQALFSPISPLSPHNYTFTSDSTDSSNPVSLDAIVESAVAPTSDVKPNKPHVDQSQSQHASTFEGQQAVLARKNKIETLLRSRPSVQSSTLSPASLPNLRTLVLTNIPEKVPINSSILPRLKTFITLCALESQLSLLQARTDYSLPPGKARFQAERRHARSLFALETIVLELVPVSQQHLNQRDWKHTRQRLNISKSSTGDPDSEALWSAAGNDFSFFGEEGEEQDECGIYEHEPGKYFPRITLDDKFVVTGEEAILSEPSTPLSSPDFDPRKHPLQGSSGAIFKSPRELPLGRNRRPSNDAQRASTPTPDGGANNGVNTVSRNQLGPAEMPGTIPTNPLAGSAITTTPRSQPGGPSHSPYTAAGQQANSSRNSAKTQETTETPMIDVKSELIKFRRERKKAYEEAVYKQNFIRINGVSVPLNTTQNAFSHKTNNNNHNNNNYKANTSISDLEVFIEGHWKGEIKVIGTGGGFQQGPISHLTNNMENGTNHLLPPSTSSRNAQSSHQRSLSAQQHHQNQQSQADSGNHNNNGMGNGRGRFQRNGMVDFFGNYFEKGYLYS